MEDPKLVRLVTDELIMLHAYRGISLEDREHLRELAMQMARRQRAKVPPNVILLIDPTRKIPVKLRKTSA